MFPFIGPSPSPILSPPPYRYKTPTSREFEVYDNARARRQQSADNEQSIARSLEQRHLVLPNKLCLWKQKVDLLDIHGLGISSNSNAEPLFVGFRNGSRMKSNITSVELCRGKFWYGKYAGPFLKASQDCEDKLNIQFRSYMPEHRGKRRLTAVKVNTSWSFIMEIPRPDDNVLVAEAFEWRHHQKYRVGASEQHQEGYVLVQLSTQQAVALLSLSGRSILSSDIQIEYLGSGTIYGGLWKLIAFVVGIFGTSDIPRARRRSSSFWPRR